MFQALNFPYDSNHDQNPSLREVYHRFAKLSTYENCHTFIYFIYDSFKEGLHEGLVSLPSDCDMSSNSTSLESSAGKDRKFTKQVRLILILCNVIAASFLICLLILCFIRLAQQRKRTKSIKRYQDTLDSIMVKIPPFPSNVTKPNVYTDFSPSLPDYDTRPLKAPYKEGNPFPPRHSVSTLSFKSEDPIVDAWEDPKKLSEKNKEIVQKWVEANEKIVQNRRESMFTVVPENKEEP